MKALKTIGTYIVLAFTCYFVILCTVGVAWAATTFFLIGG